MEENKKETGSTNRIKPMPVAGQQSKKPATSQKIDKKIQEQQQQQ